MFSRDILFNLVAVKKAFLLITADAEDICAQVYYLGSKTDTNGIKNAMAPYEAGIHPIAAGKTVRIPIDLNHAAFAGGHGAVNILSTDTAGNPGLNPFTAYLDLQRPRSTSPVGTSMFEGRGFRIPVIPQRRANSNQRFKLAITSRGLAQKINITAPGSMVPSSFLLAPGHTLLWDSALQPNVDFNQAGIGFIQVDVSQGICAVSAAMCRGDRVLSHIYPAVLMPPS